MDKKTKVALIINSLQAGGAERLAYNIAKRLDPSNFNVKVITLFTPGGQFAEALKEANIPVKHIGYRRKIKIDLYALFALRKFVTDEGIDIVQSFNYPSFFISFLSILFTKVKFLFIFQVADPSFEPLRVRVIKKFVLAFRNSFLISPSDVIKEKLVKFAYPKRKIEVIHIGVDLSEFDICRFDSDESKKSLGVLENVVLGIVGRLVPEKGHEILFYALKEVKKVIDNFILLVVGSGPIENELKKLAHELEIYDKVIFLGQRKDVAFIISSFDIYLQPSLTEAGGGIEGMAMGKPVIASDVGGMRELVENFRHGLLVKPGNIKELANAILFLIEHPEIRKEFGNKGLDKIKRVYNIEVMISKLQELYNKNLEIHRVSMI